MISWLIVVAAMTTVVAWQTIEALRAHRRERRRLDCVIELLVVWADHWDERPEVTKAALHSVLVRYVDVLVEQGERANK